MMRSIATELNPYMPKAVLHIFAYAIHNLVKIFTTGVRVTIDSKTGFSA